MNLLLGSSSVLPIGLRSFLRFKKYNKILWLSGKKPVIRDSFHNLLEDGETLIH